MLFFPSESPSTRLISSFFVGDNHEQSMNRHMVVWTGGDLHSDLGMLCLYVERLANQHRSCKMFKKNLFCTSSFHGNQRSKK